MLTDDQKSAYERDGFVCGLHAFQPDQAREWRRKIEALEQEHSAGAGGHDLSQFFRVNGQLVIPFLADIARSPTVLDAVSQILGPNLLVWSVELFTKEPGTASVVSWHQDLTYWGMGETDEELTAWIALSDVSVEAGCMRFIPGSHMGRIVEHHDTFSEINLLSRGQEIAGVDESRAVYGPLAPGEMSFHHGRCFHASGSNKSDDRRIGVAIRYVTPEVRQSAGGRDYAMLVKGQDASRGWIGVAGATDLFHPDDLSLYDEVLRHQSVALAAGAKENVNMYASAGETA